MNDWISDNAQNVALFGALLAALGAIVGAYATNLMQKRQVAAARERAAFESVMREKAEDNLKQTQEAINMITGGDAYCATSLSMPTPDGEIVAMLDHEGKYPCYDVVVGFNNLTARLAWMKAEEAKGHPPFPKPGEIHDRFWHFVSLGTIGMGPRIASVHRIKIPSGVTSLDLGVSTNQRNASVNSHYGYRLVEGKWLRKVMTHLVRGGVSTKLKEHADPGYPEEKPHEEKEQAEGAP